MSERYIEMGLVPEEAAAMSELEAVLSVPLELREDTSNKDIVLMSEWNDVAIIFQILEGHAIKLYITAREWRTLPPSIGLFSRLLVLQIISSGFSDLPLVSIPHEIGKLTALQELIITNHEDLTLLPPEIGQLIALKKLDLHDLKKLASLPLEIGQLTSLQSFNLAHCTSLISLPPEIGQLTDLQELDLHDCSGLVSLPPDVGQLTSLLRLNLRECPALASLPRELGQLTELRNLMLNDGFHVPPWLHDVMERSSIERFVEIGLMPEEAAAMVNLESTAGIRFPDGWIHGLKVQEGHLINLELDGTEFTLLPPEIGQFTALHKLNLSSQRISSLPPEIGRLASLQQLDLVKCKNLTSLPLELGQLTDLRQLNLEDVPLTAIPSFLHKLKKLVELKLTSNAMSDEEQIICKKPLVEIMTYTRQKAAINIFISHAVADFQDQAIGDLVEFLQGQQEIADVTYCENELVGNIDEFMMTHVPQTHLMLFVATPTSIKSHDCMYEIQLARRFDVPVIPLKTPELQWNQLEILGLSRELGLEYDIAEPQINAKIYQYVQKFKREVNLVEKEEGKMDKLLLTVQAIETQMKRVLEALERLDSLEDRMKQFEERIG